MISVAPIMLSTVTTTDPTDADSRIVPGERKSVTSMIATLSAGADALTAADPNEESANMLALQTRQQLGVAALGLANQAAQSILRLF